MPRLLIVEDNEVNREMLRKRLERRGFDIIASDTGEGGIELAKATKPDAIIMDLGLPGIDGWEAIRRLRAEATTANMPVVVVSAHVSSEAREKAFAVGCDDFEAKPVQLDSLVNKLTAAIAKRTGASPTLRPPTPAIPVTEIPKPLSQTAPTELLRVPPPRPVLPPPTLATPPAELGLNRPQSRPTRPAPPPSIAKGSLSDTKMLFSLPVPPGMDAGFALVETAVSIEIQQKRILVVEDNDPNRVMLCRRLEKQGYETVEARDGREAIEFAKSQRFDLVLCDIMMPEVDGYQVLQTLKADEDLKALPIIMISAVDEMASVVRCIEMGAEDYLQKPYDPVLLQARINASLDKRRLRDQELAYLRAVAELTKAAELVEKGEFDPAVLGGVDTRNDALGRLARVFGKMAREVQAKVQHLTQEVQRLKVEIDEARKTEQVAEITENAYFQELQQKASQLRRRSRRDTSQPPPTNS